MTCFPHSDEWKLDTSWLQWSADERHSRQECHTWSELWQQDVALSFYEAKDEEIDEIVALSFYEAKDEEDG
jgi:hypothetical protein